MPGGQPHGGDLADPAVGDLDFRAAGKKARAAAQHQPAHFADRRQGLAAETERADAKKIVGLRQFARCVAAHGQGEFVGRDAGAVVGDADQIESALPHGDVDPRRGGVDGVFHQFLDDARRPLDHLAGGDFVDQRLGKLADPHGGKRGIRD